MDKIYSRKKIKIPMLRIIKDKNKKNNIRKIYFIFVILIVTIITGYNTLKKIDPIFENLCVARAQGIATEITNRKTSEILSKYNYQDTVRIVKSEDGKNSMLKTDIVMINQIVSDITLEIQKELDMLENKEVKIPSGALIGMDYFAGSGPNIKLKIISAGDIATEIKTEFKSAGINQTIYRIYLNLECNVSILTTYKTINKLIENQVLLVETVVVGDVPETYLELDKN